jgi:hypothetical protein
MYEPEQLCSSVLHTCRLRPRAQALERPVGTTRLAQSASFSGAAMDERAPILVGYADAPLWSQVKLVVGHDLDAHYRC